MLRQRSQLPFGGERERRVDRKVNGIESERPAEKALAVEEGRRRRSCVRMMTFRSAFDLPPQLQLKDIRHVMRIELLTWQSTLHLYNQGRISRFFPSLQVGISVPPTKTCCFLRIEYPKRGLLFFGEGFGTWRK